MGALTTNAPAIKQGQQLKSGGASQINNRNNSISFNLQNQKSPILQKPVKKKVENLPKTGIEYPYTKERRLFLTTHKEFELLSEYSASPSLISEYIRNDLERSN